jgi:hypothetical protein
LMVDLAMVSFVHFKLFWKRWTGELEISLPDGLSVCFTWVLEGLGWNPCRLWDILRHKMQFFYNGLSKPICSFLT